MRHPGDTGHESRLPHTISDVVRQLVDIEADLDEADGLSPFVTTYRRMTEHVQQYLETGRFQNPVFTERLDVVFARHMLEPLFGYRPAPRCWQILLDLRRPEAASTRHPLQLAVAGMNAHINYDLAVALVDTCQELEQSPTEGSSVHADYLEINDVLASAFDEVKADLIKGGPAGLLDDAFGGRDDEAGLWSIIAARSAAWERARLMWRVRDLTGVREAYLLAHDRFTAVLGRAILAPTLRG